MDGFTEEVVITHIELRYTTILDFGHSAKAVLSPFSRLFDGIKIINEGLLKEQIVFRSIDRFYEIMVTSNGIVMHSKSPLESFDSYKSKPIADLFRVYNKLKELPSFHQLNNTFFLRFNLKLADRTLEENASYFHQRYPVPTVNEADVKKSVRVVVENPVLPVFEHLGYGIFNGDMSYFEQEGLDNNKWISEVVEGRVGVYAEARIVKMEDNTDAKSIVSTNKEINKILSKFWNYG